uniref:Uncharacterized protein n=1 Tax=Alexandrium catenella TaxID=2925 RepID=A0A7S1PNZ3_ALECA|mmetsp:Transcript_105904/g.282060  ORF Transcript_105904/g.282060 Transcript_105904/m.282060 type:complete len:140 (+) Transcript_105904:73-492(+)
MGSGRSRSAGAAAPAAAPHDPAESQRLLTAARRCDAGWLLKALRAGGDPDVRSKHSGRTALSFAAQCGDGAEAVRQLLSARADVHLTSHDGRTALHTAVAWERGAAVSLLCEHGASRNAADSHGLTPLSLAERRNNVSF